VTLLVLAFAFDLVTPQLLIAAILLNAPIALSSFALDRRLTIWLVAASELANLIAFYANGVREHYHWETLAFGDRFLAGLSMLLVGALTIGTQRAAQRAGRAVARQAQAQRERILRRSIEAIRASVNREVVFRTIVKEALRVLHADHAFVYANNASGVGAEVHEYARDSADVTFREERAQPEVLSLMQRARDDRTTIRLDEAHPMGRFGLSALGALSALIAPIVDRDTTFGVLIVTRSTDVEPFDSDAEEMARAFADQAAVALAQAQIFLRLADANEALSESNRMLIERNEVIRDIVYALSHDLRTPLAAAAMTLKLALNGAYGPMSPEYKAVLERSIASTEDLQRLAETLLMVARYESGEESKAREPIDLSLVANSVIEDLRALAISKRVTILMHTPDDPCFVNGDRGELRRAVANLIANAITWTPEERSIRVDISSEGDAFLLVVEDEGVGVPPEVERVLFDRLTSSESSRGAGTGLGLYIVKRIAQSHGGSIRYERRSEGGSRFVLTLPQAARVHAGS